MKTIQLGVSPMTMRPVVDPDLQDVSPFGVSISWLGLGGDTPPMDGAEKEPKEENGEKKARDCRELDRK